jgi:hypothetical protein
MQSMAALPSIFSNTRLAVHPQQSERTKKGSKKAYESCEQAWAYLGKSLLAARHAMNATIRSGRWIAIGCKDIKRIQTAVIRLKLFTVLSIPFSAVSLPSLIAKIGQNVRWKDVEGTFLASLSFGLVATDMFDSLTTFVNALLQTFSYPTVGWISTMGAPLAFSMTAMGSLSRSIRLTRLGEFHRELEKELINKMSNRLLPDEELHEMVKDYLEAKLGAFEEGRLQSQKNEAAMERKTNAKTVAMLKELKALFQTNSQLTDEETKRVLAILKKIKSTVREEMGIQAVYLFTNILNGIAVALFFVPTLPPLPFILLGISILTRLAIQFYQDHSAT